MSDITTKQIEIVLKGRDDGSLNLLGQAERRVTSLAQALRQGGDIGELSGIKKFGKNLGEFLGTSQSGTISTNAGQMRNQALAEYGETLKGVNEIEARAAAVDKARTGAMLERSNAANQLKRDLAEINALEKRQLSKGATGLLAGEYGPAEIKQEAAVSRAAAEKAYQDVLNRTVDVQLRAAKSDEDRQKAILAKAEAARQYAKQLDQINKAEAEALKPGIGTSIARGVAVAGGTLAALQFAGKVAEAWDAANQKVEEGKIKAAEWTAEFAKGLPIIGSVVKSTETLLLTITGYGKALREANQEAAGLDKKINGQNATRKRADDLVSGLVGINDTDKQKIVRESAAKLKEIQDAIDAGKADGSINEGSDRYNKLMKARADVIRKREQELGAVEATEREKRAKQVQEVENRIAEGQKAMHEDREKERIEKLKKDGLHQAAAEAEINLAADAKRAELYKQRKALEAQTGLDDNQRIGLNNLIDSQLQANEASRRSQIGAASRDAIKSVDDKINAANKELFAAKEAQRQREDAARAKAIETQQAARTSNFDGRGQTGFFNQSKSIEDSGKKTAENTKSIADTMKTVSDNIGKLFTSGALISL